MQYISYYPSPLGSILLAADETGIMGLWFEGAKYYAAGLLNTYPALFSFPLAFPV